MKKRLGAAVLDDFLDKSRSVTSTQIQSLRIMVSTATTFIRGPPGGGVGRLTWTWSQ